MTTPAPANMFNKLEQTLEPLANYLAKFCKLFSAAGMTIFMGMVILTFADVFLRYFFNSAIHGTFELTEQLMVIVVFSSIAYAQWSKNHVVMDVLTGSLSQTKKDILECITTFWSIAVVLLSLYATVRYGQKTPSITGILQLPFRPFIYFAAFGFFTLLLTLIWDQIKALAKAAPRGPGMLLLIAFFALVPLLLAYLAATSKLPLSQVQVGFAGIVVMFVLFLSGMPVAFVLMAVGFIFSSTIRSQAAAMNMYGKAMYATSASYAWSPLMFFMLMGYFCFFSEFGRDLFLCARRWIGHLRGGLAQGSVVACTAFGAVVGDVLSGSIAMSAIALPEMRRNHYDDTLAVGTLACSSTIGALIPPSTTLILYGVLAELSIADLFMAGVIPGLICMVCFMLANWLRIYLNPSLAPNLPKEPMRTRLQSLRAALPILALFTLVIGGIYGGIFTPTEGGGIGAAGTLILAILMRRMSWPKLIASFNESAKFITMCFTVLTGATVFGYFMTLSRIPMVLAGGIAAMGWPGWLTLLAIVLVMLFLGCFIPAMPLLLICTPIFIPIAAVYHWDLIWFGIIIALLINMAGITPPFGINLFVMKGLADVSLGTMYRASIPFIIFLFVAILIVMAFPATATWLPMILRAG